MSIGQRRSSDAVHTGAFGLWGAAVEYMIDATQRSVLFWDVMRQRGNQYSEHLAETAPHVLDYGAELVVDGRKLERPVNYSLVRIVPPPGVEIDLTRRPFVVVDPRAGHGPGIGGFKADSEIGVVFKAGHPCYFIGFLPDPMPGQTIEDISRAEASRGFVKIMSLSFIGGTPRIPRFGQRSSLYSTNTTNDDMAS
jgi:Protein of unknown function (DUF3141)